MTEREPTAAPSTSVEDTEKRRKSSGESFFDWTVYGAMNYVGTFLLTLKLAYEIKHGVLNKQYKGWAEALKKAKVPPGIAEAGLATFITFWGGNVMLLPVRVAESFKVGIVSTLNKWMGDDTDPALIKEAPKQTWGTLLLGRIVAFSVVLVSMLTAEYLFKKPFDRFQKHMGEMFERNFSHRWKAPKAYHYGEMASLDMFATAASSILLYVSSHMFARKREEKIEQRQQHAHENSAVETRKVAADAINDAPRVTLEAAPRHHEQTVVSTPALEAQVSV